MVAAVRPAVARLEARPGAHLAGRRPRATPNDSGRCPWARSGTSSCTGRPRQPPPRRQSRCSTTGPRRFPAAGIRRTPPSASTRPGPGRPRRCCWRYRRTKGLRSRPSRCRAIVLSTRELARARMAQPDRLLDWALAVPTSMVLACGPRRRRPGGAVMTWEHYRRLEPDAAVHRPPARLRRRGRRPAVDARAAVAGRRARRERTRRRRSWSSCRWRTPRWRPWPDSTRPSSPPRRSSRGPRRTGGRSGGGSG